MPSLERYAYILLAHNKWWKQLCGQRKAGKTIQAFVRKGLVGPRKTEMLLFYVTHPRKEIRGYATFIERITGDVYDLWSAYGHEASHKSYNAYLNFLQGRRKATFIRFRDLRELGAAVPVSTLSKITGKSRMPRSGTYISEEMAHTLLSEDNRLEEV